MLEIFDTLSTWSRDSAARAWPASWWAMISFYLGLMIRDFRSSPPTIRSRISGRFVAPRIGEQIAFALRGASHRTFNLITIARSA